MKNLLYKELRLCVPVQTWIFVALNCLCIIPNYPAVKRSPNIGQFSSMQGGRFLREIQQRTKIKMGQGL